MKEKEPRIDNDFPNEWEMVRLNDVCKKIQDGNYGADYPKASELLDDGVPFLTSKALGGLGDLIPEKFDFISNEKHQKLKKAHLKLNDILFTNRGANVGVIGMVSEIIEDGNIGPQLTLLRANERIEHLFLKEVMKSFFVQDQVKRQDSGSAMNFFGIKDTSKFKIPLPPIPEQKAIDNLTQLTTEKQQKKKALMQQLLTGKKRFPGFDGEWKEYSYKELIKEVKRPVKWDDDELYHLVSVRRRSGGLFERDSLYGHQILTKNLRTAKAGDFLISKMQVLHGASVVVTEEFDDKKISGSYIAVRARDEKILDINFLDWYSKMPYFYHQTYISSYGVHIEKMTFDFKSFLKLEMKVPEYEEQQKIAEVLNAATKEIKILNQKLDALKDQKKGLMQQLLTGKKRLNYDSK